MRDYNKMDGSWYNHELTNYVNACKISRRVIVRYTRFLTNYQYKVLSLRGLPSCALSLVLGFRGLSKKKKKHSCCQLCQLERKDLKYTLPK
jgi:hypothetical protein